MLPDLPRPDEIACWVALLGVFCRSLEDDGIYSRAQMPSDEILTLREVAKHLKVGEKTVYTMAQNKELPSFKVRGQWRFRREDIDHWIDEQKARTAQERE